MIIIYWVLISINENQSSSWWDWAVNHEWNGMCSCFHIHIFDFSLFYKPENCVSLKSFRQKPFVRHNMNSSRINICFFQTLQQTCVHGFRLFNFQETWMQGDYELILIKFLTVFLSKLKIDFNLVYIFCVINWTIWI